MPRIVFSMKMESGLWTLNDIAITIKLPLADPDLLKSISDGMKARAAACPSADAMQGMGQASGQILHNTFGGDANVLAAVRKILAAETTYAATYPAVGYTCTLSDLDGFGAAEPNEHQAMLISSGLASGKNQGHNFSLSGCAGRAPATSFRLTAAPFGDELRPSHLLCGPIRSYPIFGRSSVGSSSAMGALSRSGAGLPPHRAGANCELLAS